MTSGKVGNVGGFNTYENQSLFPKVLQEYLNTYSFYQLHLQRIQTHLELLNWHI